MHAVAGNFDEGVIFLAGLPFGRRLEIASQWKAVNGPRGLPSPWSLVFGVALHADEIESGTLHPIRDREDHRQVRVARAFVGQRVFQQSKTVRVAQQHAKAKPTVAIAIIVRPQGDELAALLPRQAARRQ